MILIKKNPSRIFTKRGRELLNCLFLGNVVVNYVGVCKIIVTVGANANCRPFFLASHVINSR